MGRLGAIKLFSRSFTGRIIAGLMLTQVLLAPLLFYGILSFIERGFQSQFVDQVRSNTRLYATLMESAVAENNILNQEAVLSEAFLSENLVLAELMNADGTTIRLDVSEQSNGSGFREDFSFGENGDHVYHIATELINDTDGTSLGSLRLGYDESSTQLRIDVAYRYGSLLALGYALLSVMIALFFGRRLTRPISQLQNVARSIATGETEVALTVNTDILEISALSKDLDSMRRTLVDRHRDVRDREKRLGGILDNAGEGIISIDSRGIIASFNRAAESIFGYSSVQVIGKNVAMLMPPPDRDQHDTYISNYLGTGETKVIGSGRRVQARHRDGRVFPVNLNVTEIQLDQEHIYIGMVHDLTDEEEKDRQLLQSWRVVEQSPISIVITDAHGLIEYVNPHFCRLTGYQADEVYGVNPHILKSGNTKADTYADLWKTILRGDIWRGEFQNRKKNGELFWESATVCPVHNKNQEITHFIALKEDITEHRQKDRMLNQAMKLEAVGRMTDGIAHDFNNLLTIILGNLQYLQEESSMLGRAEIKELISDAVSAAHDGSNLIKQLLIFSRRKEHDVKPMALSTFMERVQYLLSRAIPADIDMRLEVARDIGSVLIDSNRLESALLNVVINARDAMAGGGELVISMDKVKLAESEAVEGGHIAPGNYVFIKVVDNGTGMSDDIRRQALEPFFTTKTAATGTGLGLSMVHDLIIKSGGGVRIESEVDTGTTVTLILPAYEQAVDLAAAEPAKPDHLPGGKETVLVVEDQEKVRRFAARVLNGLGYRVIEAEDAAQALVHLQSNDGIDLLFSDVSMPGGMDGRQLAQRANKLQPSLKILLTTGMELQVSDDGDNQPSFPLIDKPYSAETLAHSVRSVLNTGNLAS